MAITAKAAAHLVQAAVHVLTNDKITKWRMMNDNPAGACTFYITIDPYSTDVCRTFYITIDPYSTDVCRAFYITIDPYSTDV